MNEAKLRSWRSAKQGLDESVSNGVLAHAGWARSVGGATPYLVLHSRAGTTFQQANASMAAKEIYELPAARGCTYVLPREDFALGLAAGRIVVDPGKLTSAENKVGLTLAEIESLGDAVCTALEPGTLDPAAIRNTLGDKVKSYGELGKKVGMTTNLPCVLGRLQARGLIVRVPVDGRLDTQRYAYSLWKEGPGDWSADAQETAAALALKFAAWIGPFTLEEFRWFSGFNAGLAKHALAHESLVDYGDGLIGAKVERDSWEGFQAQDGAVRFVGSLDNLFHLTRNLPLHVDEADRARDVVYDSKTASLGGLSEVASHAIVQGGRLIGLWDYDPAGPGVVWKSWAGDKAQVAAEADRVEVLCAEMGDARTFSLDSPKSRAVRLASLQAGP